MSYLTAIRAPDRQLSSSLIFTGLTISDDNIVEWEHTSNLIPGDTFEIGTAIADFMTVTIHDPDRTIWSSFDFKEKEFTLKLSVKDGVSWVEKTIGIFTVESAEENKGRIQITGIDRIWKFDQPYINDLTYPATVLQIAQSVCAQAGVTLATVSFANSTYELDYEPTFTNITQRMIIEAVAELAGGYAKINTAGALEIITLQPVGAVAITGDNYLTLQKDKVAQALIDKVIVQTGNVAVEEGAGTHPYGVVNNLLVQTPSEVVSALYTVLNGTQYTALAMKWQGDPDIRPGRYFQIDENGDTVYTYAMNRTRKYAKGGMREEFKAPQKSDVIATAQNGRSLILNINNIKTEIQVLDGKIELKVDSTELDALGTEISKAQTSIGALEDEILLYVKTTDLTQTLTNYATLGVTDQKVAIAVGTLQTTIDEHGTVLADINKTFDFTTEGLIIGESGSQTFMTVDNDQIFITENGEKVMEIKGKQITLTELIVQQTIKIGVHHIFKYEPTVGDAVTIVSWIGG